MLNGIKDLPSGVWSKVFKVVVEKLSIVKLEGQQIIDEVEEEEEDSYSYYGWWVSLNISLPCDGFCSAFWLLLDLEFFQFIVTRQINFKVLIMFSSPPQASSFFYIEKLLEQESTSFIKQVKHVRSSFFVTENTFLNQVCFWWFRGRTCWSQNVLILISDGIIETIAWTEMQDEKSKLL